jgi:hypothetical protein
MGKTTGYVPLLGVQTLQEYPVLTVFDPLLKSIVNMGFEAANTNRQYNTS